MSFHDGYVVATPEQRIRWVKALSFVESSPLDHPIRSVNRSYRDNRDPNGRPRFDPLDHLAALEVASREQPLTGAAALAYKASIKAFLRERDS